MRQKSKYNHETLFLEFTRYCLAGGIAFIFDYSVLYALTQFAALHYLISSLAGFVTGILINYILSRRWVFKNSEAKGMEAFFTFLIIGIVGLAMTESCMWIGVDLLNLNYMFVKIVVTGVVLLWNFTARKILVFNARGSVKLSRQN